MVQLVIGIVLLLVGALNLCIAYIARRKGAASVPRRNILGTLLCVIGIADIFFWFIKGNLPPP